MQSIQDFLTNPEFVRWVQHPNRQLDDYWRKWINANPDQVDNFKLAREFLMRIKIDEIEPEAGDKEELLSALLKNRTALPEKEPLRSLTKQQSQRLWPQISLIRRVAAILAAGFFITWLLMEKQDLPEKELATNPPKSLIKETLAGEKLHLKLADGTHIWLNSKSQFEFPDRFDPHERRVKLVGEAFFDVAEDSSRPFVVETKGLSATVLGTSFNISTKENELINVSLVSGKLKVTPDQNMRDFYLEPGKQLSFDTQLQKEKINDFDVNYITAWKEGKLYFRDAGLPEVVSILEDWYGVKITLINGTHLDWNYSGEFQRQTLESVLNSLSYTQKFTYSIKGKEVTFKF
jgi:transmembrane sensor